MLPFWVTAFLSLCAACLFLTYAGTYWGATAQVFARFGLSGAALWSVFGAMIGSRSFAAAEWWAQFVPGVMFAAMAGLIEAELQVINRHVPRWYRWVWVVAVASVVIFLVPGVHLVQRLHVVPDGYIMVVSTGWPVVLRWPTFIASFAFGLVVLVRHVRRFGVSRRGWFYLAAAVGVWACIFNDLVWVQRHVTPYPTSWVAGLFVMAVLWYELEREVRRVARQLNRDKLTGARSRSAGEQYAAARLQSGALGVVLCDVDGFKQINDALGHAAGDRVLCHVVDRLHRHCGPDDWVVRLGGDEFVLLLPGREREATEAVAARLSAAGSGDVGDEATADVSLSAGWAWSGPAGDFFDLMDKADRAMYAEKRRRRAAVEAART